MKEYGDASLTVSANYSNFLTDKQEWRDKASEFQYLIIGSDGNAIVTMQDLAEQNVLAHVDEYLKDVYDTAVAGNYVLLQANNIYYMYDDTDWTVAENISTTYESIDTLNAATGYSVEQEGTRPLAQWSSLKNYPIAAAWQANLTINYRGTPIDKELMRYASAKNPQEIANVLWFRMTFDGLEIEKRVTVQDCVPEFNNGLPVTFSITLIERG